MARTSSYFAIAAHAPVPGLSGRPASTAMEPPNKAISKALIKMQLKTPDCEIGLRIRGESCLAPGFGPRKCLESYSKLKSRQEGGALVHQNRSAIAITSDFRVDGAKSPEIPQKEGDFGLRNRGPKSQIASDFPSHPQIAMQSLGNR